MLTAFFWRHIPASTIANPAFIKITRIVAINNQRLSAKKEAACGPVKSERATSALAEKVKTPNPKRANGIEASHAQDWLLLKPLILLRRSIGPFKRLASWRREVVRLGGDCKAVVINDAYFEKKKWIVNPKFIHLLIWMQLIPVSYTHLTLPTKA